MMNPNSTELVQLGCKSKLMKYYSAKPLVFNNKPLRKLKFMLYSIGMAMTTRILLYGSITLCNTFQTTFFLLSWDSTWKPQQKKNASWTTYYK